MQILLDICSEFGDEIDLEYNMDKSFFIVFGTQRFNNAFLTLNNKQLLHKCDSSYLGMDFTYDMNMKNIFNEKMKSVSISFFSLNPLAFFAGGVNAYLQARVYKSMCLSLLLYGLEVFKVSTTTLRELNTTQNGLIRYMTGLSKYFHISKVRKLLKIFTI
jgi:hypothetical protein